MKPVKRLFFIILAISILLVPVLAADDLNLTEEEKAWLAEHPVIRVHNELDWPPFNFYEADQPLGYSIEYMNLLAKNIGIEIEYISGPSWNDFLDMIRDKELDVMLNIVNTEDRQKYILFTEPYLHTLTGIYVRKGGREYNSLFLYP